MSRFFIHVRCGDALTEDLEGYDLPTFEEAQDEAFAAAREILAEQRQIEKPLTWIVQELEASALKSQWRQQPLPWHIDVKGKQRYRRRPGRPLWRIGRKRGDVRCDLEPGNAGCLCRCNGHAQSSTM